jgi:hypothetical protein
MNATASKNRELSERGKKPSSYRRIVTEDVNVSPSFRATNRCRPMSSVLFPATSTL